MERILIIDKDKETAQLVRDYLELSAYEVCITECGVTGLSYALEREIHAVILEVDLEESNGFELCKAIRNKKDIPVLFLSNKTEDINKIRALGLGADDYVEKPCSPNELVARVKAHISRYERLCKCTNIVHEIIEVNGLKIDTTSHRVWVDDKEIAFTTREFEVLSFLAKNPNRVFSKKELFEAVWDQNLGTDSSTVIVHIKKVREKIEKDILNPVYIETIWGSGYRFFG